MSQLNSGPPPNPSRRRRNATVPMVPLPSCGRQGDLPVWPLRPDVATAAALEDAQDARLVLEDEVNSETPPKGVHARLARLDQKIRTLEARLEAAAELELELWRELWSTPQAVQWDRLGWRREVAQYVRWKVAAELGDLNASKEARQLSDRLGLTPLAMLRLRWEIVDQAPAVRVAPAADGTTVTDIASRRKRLS